MAATFRVFPHSVGNGGVSPQTAVEKDGQFFLSQWMRGGFQ